MFNAAVYAQFIRIHPIEYRINIALRFEVLGCADIEQPTLTCPSDVTVDTDNGSATAYVNYLDIISAVDNSEDIPTISPDPTATFPANLGIGANPFTFTATDSSGNADTCTFTITVQDIEQPTLTCPSDVTVEAETGSATVLVDYSAAINASDNSGVIPTISPDPTASFPANLGIGANPFTFTATDSFGNADTCTFIITVQDIEQPTLTCPSDVTVDTDNGAATAYVNYLDTISAVDNSEAVPTISPDPTATFPANLGIGEHPFTFTATDWSGNTDTCMFTITVQDIEQPALTCPSDVTVDTDIDAATASVDYSGRVNASDNSEDIPTISPDPTATFPANLGIGSSNFTFTATDSSGNTDTCTFTITVQDIEQPTLTCPSDVTVETETGSATASVDYSVAINTSDNSEAVPTISPDPAATFPANLGIGSNPFTFTATDSSGNADTCTFTITVQGLDADESVQITKEIVNDFKEFEGYVLSQLADIKSTGEKVYDERNYVGLAKIESVNGNQSINNSLERFNESKVEFALQVETDKEGEVLVVAAYSNHTMKNNEVVNETVVVAGLDGVDVEFMYLTDKIFSCSIYDIENLVNLNAKLNFSIIGQLVTTFTVDIQPICLFVNETLWTWSDEGIKTTYQSQDKISCYSDHITSFSVLMKVSNAEVSQKDQKTLSVMSKVCVSLSLIALVVSLLIYCSFPELWKSLRNSIHKNLVVNMILMESLFIFGIDKTGNKITCTIIRVLLHLTSLNTFTWMCGEAVYLLFKVCPSAPSRYNRLRNFMALCYSIPLVIVLFSSAFGYNVDDEICWLSQETGMIWAFVAPAICIAMLNTAIMCIVVKTIYERSGNMVGKPAAEVAKFKQLRKATRGTVMLLPLLGTTWLIGPFAVSSDAVFVEYLFNLLNGCQGIFIFLIYCVFDNETKICLKKRFMNNQVSPPTEMAPQNG